MQNLHKEKNMEKRNESNMLIKNDLQTEITRLKKVVQDQKNEIEKLRRENSAWIPVSTGIFPRDKEIVQVTYLGFSDEKHLHLEKMEIGIGIQKGLELQLKLQPGNQSARRMKKKRCMMEFLN